MKERRDLGWVPEKSEVCTLEPKEAYGFKYDIFFESYVVLEKDGEAVLAINLPRKRGTRKTYRIVEEKEGEYAVRQEKLSAKLAKSFSSDPKEIEFPE